MATRNQKIVAEALRLARVESFGSGFAFLCKNTKPMRWETDKARFKWFAKKCEEHGLITRSELITAFEQLGFAANNATTAIQEFKTAHDKRN